MTGIPRWTRVMHNERRGSMNTLLMVVAFVFVFATVALVLYALFEMSPFAHHREQFRDSRTGAFSGKAPHLD
jgi:hypothetical protein